MDTMVKFLWPEPVGPLFKQGAPLEGWNEDLTLTAFMILVLAVLDVLIVRPFIHHKGRYFALHACANAVSAWASFPDLYRALTNDPRRAFSGPSQSMLANSAVAAIHLYHIMAFKLRREDIVHHAVFVIILSGLAIPYKQVGGAANNFGCFFLSGFPGGVDFVLLTLVAQGIIAKRTEKRLNRHINVWIRGPSMSCYMLLGWVSYMHDIHRQYSEWILLLIVALHFVNGQYYMAQAVESNARHEIKEDKE